MRRAVAVGVSLVALAWVGSASAQDAPAGNPPAAATTPPDDNAPRVDDIIVTAQKRAENLQDVPVAVSAVTGKTLENKRILDLVDLSNATPGLQIKSDDNGANPRIFIRGVGVNDFNPATASAVGIYADGVYVGSPLAQRFAFFDLQQAEVLRGPQGTLYGRNTTGGAVNVTSRKPGNDVEADFLAEYGRFNSVNLQGGVSLPLAKDLLSVRVAGIYQRDDGYSVNRLTGDRGNNADRWAVRGSVHFTPSGAITDDLAVTVGKSRGGSIWAYNRSLFPVSPDIAGPDGLCAPAYYGTANCTNVLGYANASKNLYEGDYSFEGKDRVNLFTVANTLTINLGSADIVAVTGYQHAKRNDQEETDANPLPVITASYIARQNTFSQELRLQSSGKPALRYVFGLYYAHDDLTNNSAYDVLAILPADPAAGIGRFIWPLAQKTDSYAAFGQVDYDLTSRLTATVGLRYSADHKDFHYFSGETNTGTPFFTFDGSKTFDSVSGKFGLQYRFTPDVNAYASYSRGTKSGGFFSGQTGNIADIGPYKDETVNAYEAGLKTELLHHTLRANLAAFYYDYQNLQVYTTVIDGFITRQLFTNASAARMYGGELELEATPARGLTISMNAAYLNATYRNFASAGADYSGNTLPSAPKISVQTAVDYTQPVSFGAIVANVSASYRSKVFFDTANTSRLSDQARVYVDGRLGVQLVRNKLEIGVWGKNIFGETNISDITPIASLGFDVVSVGPPRTYGLYLRAHY
jgi:iron complex outermembrane receptor protein